MSTKKAFIEAATARIFHHPVKIKAFNIHWVGLEPVVNAKGVTVQSEDHLHTLLHVGEISFRLGVLQSLFHFQLLPDHLVIKGAHVNLKQLPDHTWQVLGVGGLKASESKLSDAKVFVYWLATQSTVSISGVNGNIQFANGHTLQLSQLKLQVRHHFMHHEIVAVGDVVNQHQTDAFKVVVKPEDIKLGPDKFGASFYLNLPQLHFVSWWGKSIFKGVDPVVQLKQGKLGAQVWGSFKSGHMQSVRGLLTGDGLELASQASKKTFSFEKLHTQFYWQRSMTGWQFLLDQLNVKIGQTIWPLHQLAVEYSREDGEQRYAFKGNAATLAMVKQLASLFDQESDKDKQLIKQLSPTGVLNHIAVHLQLHPNGKKTVQWRTDFNQVNVAAYKHFPGFNNLSGSILSSGDQGKIQINSAKSTLVYPYLFSQPMNLSTLLATVKWHWTPQSGLLLRVPQLKLDTGNLRYQGHVSIAKRPNAFPEMDLTGVFDVNDVGRLSRYVPKRGMSLRLQTWLRQAFKGGQVSNGQVLIAGQLGNDQQFPKLLITMAENNLSFHYAPHWPSLHKVNSHLTFRNHSMTIVSDHALTVGNPFSLIKANIEDMRNPDLTILAKGKLQTSQGLAFLRQSPLSIGDVAKNWQGDGRANITLKIDKPLLPDDDQTQVLGQLKLMNNSLKLFSGFPTFTNINGELSFKNKLLGSKKITANFMGQPLITTISSLVSSGQQNILFHLAGSLDSAAVQKSLTVPLLKFTHGHFPYRGLLNISSNGKLIKGNLSLSSDLVGLGVDLPAPYKKSSKQPHPVSMRLSFDTAHHLALHVNYKKLISLFARYHYLADSMKLEYGELRLGEGVTGDVPSSGFIIDGYLPKMDWHDWSGFLGPYFSLVKTSKSKHTLLSNLRQVDLEVREVSALDQKFGNTYFHATPEKSGWLLDVSNRNLSGTVFMPNNHQKQWKIRVEHLDLTLSKKNKSHLVGLKTTLNPKTLPPIDFDCADCSYNKNKLGHIVIKTRKLSKGLGVDQFIIKNKSFFLKTKGSWTCPHQHCLTDLYGYVSNYNLGNFLKDFGLTHVVSHGFGETVFSLDWQGSPFKVNWQHISGDVSFQYSDGRIMKLSPSAENKIGLGRVLNLLSLQSLPQNILTGFTHIGQKGFEFNTLKGQVKILDGVGRTKNVELVGPIAWVDLSGLVNLREKKYDIDMNIVPNVTSSIPLIVGLAGGPVAGAVTWVVNKVLASKIGEVAKVSYHVGGSMSKPILSKNKD